MVCSSTNDSDLDSILGVPSGVSINDVDSLAGIQVVNSSFTVDEPDIFRLFNVDRSPPDFVSGRLLVDDSLVLWRPTGLFTRGSGDGTRGSDG